MLITEIVKGFFKEPEDEKLSSQVEPDNTILDLTQDDTYPNTGSFFDDDHSNFFTGSKDVDLIFKQKDKIMKYRQMSMSPDICDAIEEIVNEIIFVVDDSVPIKIDIDEENEKLVKAISEKFDKIVKLTDVKRNAFQIVKQGYIDGKIVMHCAYDENNTKNGMRKIKMIDPCMFYYDGRSQTYKYMKDDRSTNVTDDKKEYSVEEIVVEDFGLYDGKLNLGYLEYAIKPANILKTLEDLLIPMRFSRSISRRVFNVDIGSLPSKRGAEVMREHQSKFKYKKFYNNETGEVSNQQHITSMVEDYWFANRSGGKGTTVDVLDETGNLGELDDILYFARKLYRAMKIPSNRLSIDPDSDKDFAFDETRVTKEDLKFFMFISRLRQVYSSVFKELLKREVISTGIMKESEWNDKEDLIEITFINQSKFIEKMNLDAFMSKLDIYATAQDYNGKLFSVNTVLKDIFRFSDEEIEDELKKIQKEEKDPLYAKFYQSDEDGF